METTKVFWGYVGITENKMETTVVHWGYIGIMENKMETTITTSGVALFLFGSARFDITTENW